MSGKLGKLQNCKDDQPGLIIDLKEMESGTNEHHYFFFAFRIFSDESTGNEFSIRSWQYREASMVLSRT